GCPCLLSRGENGPEVVARMTEAARRHIAIEQIDVAHKTGVEERCLIRGGVAAADQRAPARSPVFLELFAQRLEGLSWQCSDGGVALHAPQPRADRLSAWRAMFGDGGPSPS